MRIKRRGNSWQRQQFQNLETCGDEATTLVNDKEEKINCMWGAKRRSKGFIVQSLRSPESLKSWRFQKSLKYDRCWKDKGG